MDNDETKYQTDYSFDVEFAARNHAKTQRAPIVHDDGVYYGGFDERGLLDGKTDADNTGVDDTMVSLFLSFLQRVPAIFISLLLVLFQTVSFGGIVFPGHWQWPSFIPHAIGFQMMLFATITGQLFLTFTSCFDFAVALVMVENVQLMHGIANVIMSTHQHSSGSGTSGGAEEESIFLLDKVVYSTTMIAFAISTAVTGLMFLLLGYFRLGSIVSSFPRHTIVGLIGGIGVFLATSGFEVSTNTPWYWTTAGVKQYFSPELMPLWTVSVTLLILLRVITAITQWKNVTPFFFLSIPFAFYAVLLAFSIPIQDARDFGFFFPATSEKATQSFLMWELIDVTSVDWFAIFKCLPTMLALVIFSLSHVPINIPSLCMSTNSSADMNTELVSHGYFNFVSGMLGGLPSYLCYCISLVNYKLGKTSDKRKHSKFGGRLVAIGSGLTICLLEVALFFEGPAVLGLIPRCLGGKGEPRVCRGCAEGV